MTILVAYAPRPEGRAALSKGIQMATQNNEKLVVVNASPGGAQKDESFADSRDAAWVQHELHSSGLDTEFKQFVRGKDAVEEIVDLVEELSVSLLVIGLRRRSPVGKLILGSTAQEILLTVDCPVLAVKAR
ncbi:universal stress protein [Arthrobacter sulfonylureivorans]|uniref:universal stress protein n=1 Tax=Arthrobacter TaxID=1663 RepID=UPI0010AD6C5C|nr:universal stress protein [Arthrobacter sp. CAU 1506]TJY69278.1 universal stress protein [Arthrobacter sp. CAU 1506]